MYRIKLDNCCCEPKITMEFNFEKSKFAEVITIATGGFKQVDVVDNETGELIYSRYVCDQHFACLYGNIAKCIEGLLKFARYEKGV